MGTYIFKDTYKKIQALLSARPDRRWGMSEDFYTVHFGEECGGCDEYSVLKGPNVIS